MGQESGISMVKASAEAKAKTWDQETAKLMEQKLVITMAPMTAQNKAKLWEQLSEIMME